MTELRDVRLGQSLCAVELRKATEAAARTASCSDKADFTAAMDSMECALEQSGLSARLFLGEDPADSAPRLHHRRLFGRTDCNPVWDVMVDPAEGACFMAPGLTNALACAAAAPFGALYDPGPAFYMEKFVIPPAAKGRIDPRLPIVERLALLARLLDKPVAELTVYVQEKPRHRDLIARIAAAGAKTALYPAGDVAGAVMAAIPGSGIDALMGIGGCREGMIAACAVKMLGGDFMARPAPQLGTERQAVSAAGIDTEAWLGLNDLIRSETALFCATGIADGLLLDGLQDDCGTMRIQSVVIGAPDSLRQILTSWQVR
jgi:fructose-1,6-bisphosphatase II